jgi:hypothetical protein
MSVYTVGSNKSSDSIFPKVRPSLDLDFANSKTLDPRITFTRSSGGSYVGADGLIKYAGVNEARFDHNPVTGESLGLLVEEQRTNLQRHSEDFTQGLPLLNATLTANVGTAPNGTLTADQFIETTANGLHNQEIVDHVFIAGVTYTFSCYAKTIGNRNFSPGFPTLFGSARFGNFNLTGSGSVVSTSAGVTASIQSVGDGWYRCSITSTCVTGGGARVGVFIASGTSISYAGDVSKGLLLWGAQLEVGAFPTSYIPTVASTRTRFEDVARIVGANFSSWYRQDEGTVLVDVLRSYSGNFSTFPNIFQFNDGTANNIFAMYGVFGSQFVTNFSIQSGGVSQTNFIQVFTNVPGPNRIAQALAVNSSMLAANGALTLQDSSVAMPVGINRVNIGSDLASLSQWGGTIRRITYWPKRLPNSQLRALTR